MIRVNRNTPEAQIKLFTAGQNEVKLSFSVSDFKQDPHQRLWKKTKQKKTQNNVQKGVLTLKRLRHMNSYINTETRTHTLDFDSAVESAAGINKTSTQSTARSNAEK